MATEHNCAPYPKITNPSQFAIELDKSADEITIGKIKHDIKLKKYAVLTVVDSNIWYFLQKVFGFEIFADMNTNNNFVLNKYTALQMQQHLDLKFNKLNPNHIKDVYAEFEMPPTSGAPIGLYFAK